MGASSITPNKKEAYAAVEANSSENIDIVGEKSVSYTHLIK